MHENKLDEILSALLANRDSNYTITKEFIRRKLFDNNINDFNRAVQTLLDKGYIENPGNGTTIRLTVTGNSFIEEGGFAGRKSREKAIEIKQIKKQEEDEKAKKKNAFYKKWGFWIGVVLLAALAVLSYLFPNPFFS